MTTKPHVLCLGNPDYIPPSYLTTFQNDFTYAVLPATNRAETLSQLPTYIATHGPIDAFIIRMGTKPYEPINAELLSPLLPHCRIIVSASAGYNEFDVKWMTEHGVLFCNTVDAVAEATADMGMWLVLSVVRNTSVAERNVRGGRWREGVWPSGDVGGLKLGLVGMGAIGKYMAKKAIAFNMEIHYHNRKRLPTEVEKQFNATYHSSLHSLLSTSDVVSINCPLNANTKDLISYAEFDVMSPGTYLVNTARGPIINEDALIEALESGKIARAGLDVFNNEPRANEYFKTSDKVILQPHMGGLTVRAYAKAEMECFENVRALWRDGRANSAVNEEGVRERRQRND